MRPATNKGLWRHLLEDESGQDLVEYALLAALVGLGAVAAMGSLATNVATSFNAIGSSLTSAT